MQKFATYETIVSDHVDDMFGERIRIEPRADGEFAKVGSDPGRPAIDVTAVVDFEPKVLKSRNSGRFDADSTDLSGEKLHVSVKETLVPYRLRAGDHVLFLDRGAPYPAKASVATVEPDGLGRILIRCTAGAGR